jgi:mRNA interferase HigB
MRVIKRSALVEFWREHPDARAGLEEWFVNVRKASWKTPPELRQTYNHADFVGRRTIFNIAGNKYRLIARVNYPAQIVFVLYIMTHAEYDKGAWKR